MTFQIFRHRVEDAGIALHGADCLFYFSQANRAVLVEQDRVAGGRRLTLEDEAAFRAFEASATEQGLDDAYVELDHWAVFGSFEQDRLVNAASKYPWQDARIADLGVLTIPSFRGLGHARGIPTCL